VRNVSQISTLDKPVEFFRELVVGAVENQRIRINEDSEYYLVNLLVKYMQSDVFNNTAKDPLAIKLHRSMIVEQAERVRILREIGDFALYMSGFFADSLNRKIIDIDYYIAMGGAAYFNLSNALAQAALQDLYKDLHQRFITYVDILSEVSDQAFSHSNKDVLRLYEKWLKTRSERLEALLKKEGIVPNATLNTKRQ